MKNRFLANTPLFALLSDEERQLLSERFTLRAFADGAALFRQGDPARALFLVKSGMVRLVEGQGEAERVRATYGPSSLLGELDLLLDRAHDATALAQGPVDAWELSRKGLAEAMAERPTMSIKLSAFLNERIAAVDPYLTARLGGVGVLAPLDDEALQALARALVLRTVRRGALIFQSGAHADHLYLVESGTVTLVSTAPDDPEPFRQIGPGELFGHEALLRDRPYGAVARAATDVQLWALSRADFEHVAAGHPPLRQALSAHISEQGLAPADRAAARAALERVPIFAGLPDALLDTIVSRMTLRHVGTNETIYTAGDAGDAFFLIDRGAVKLMEDATLVERKEQGDFFGEMALLTGKPRGRTARAARPTNLWVLPKRDFDAVAVRYPELTTAVSRTLSRLLAREGRREEGDELSLSMFPLFTGLTPREQADVARRLRPMRVAANEAIFRRGAVPDAFYLVQRGQVKLVSDQGVFDLVRAGGFFGEMALLTGNTHTMTAQTIEDTELLLLDRGQFEAVMGRYPSVALVLSRALSARLEAASARGRLPTAAEAPTRQHPLPPAARGTADAARSLSVPAAAAHPRRSRSPWALVKLALVLAPLLWLTGVVAPTLLLDAASDDPASPLHGLLLIGASPTPLPTPTPAPTSPQ